MYASRTTIYDEGLNYDWYSGYCVNLGHIRYRADRIDIFDRSITVGRTKGHTVARSILSYPREIGCY